jgi:hypothetical protein
VIRRRDATDWTGTRHGVGPYCRTQGRYVGTGTERVTIHVTSSAVVDGVQTATALEAYYRATLRVIAVAILSLRGRHADIAAIS